MSDPEEEAEDGFGEGPGAELAVAYVSVATTKRRRFQWALWTEGPPRERPFRPPDQHGGGAKTFEEALAAAEAAAGRVCQRLEGRWARAWSRVLQGHPPWPRRAGHGEAPKPAAAPTPRSAWDVLGLPPHADRPTIRAAFRALAKVHHPDHGGDPEAFRELHAAYERALRRRRR